jgi:hypothetical protein
METLVDPPPHARIPRVLDAANRFKADIFWCVLHRTLLRWNATTTVPTISFPTLLNPRWFDDSMKTLTLSLPLLNPIASCDSRQDEDGVCSDPTRPLNQKSCLSSAKLRSTDSVNPRAVLSRVRPRYRLYSKHRDRRCWTCPGIGIRVSFRTLEGTQLFRTEKDKRRGRRSGTSLRSTLPVVLSKAALSGPSVCLRARAPCPLRVSCLRIARERSSRVPAGAQQWIAPSSRSDDPVPHPPGPRGRAARAAGLRSGGWLLGTRQVTRPAFSSRTDCSAKNRQRRRACIRTSATNLFITVPTLTRISAVFSRVCFCHV